MGIHVGGNQSWIIMVKKSDDILYGKVVSSRRAIKGSYCQLFVAYGYLYGYCVLGEAIYYLV